MQASIDPAVEALTVMRALRDSDGEDDARTLLRDAEMAVFSATPTTCAGAIDLLNFITDEVHDRDINPNTVVQAIWRCIEVLERKNVAALAGKATPSLMRTIVP